MFTLLHKKDIWLAENLNDLFADAVERIRHNLQ